MSGKAIEKITLSEKEASDIRQEAMRKARDMISAANEEKRRLCENAEAEARRLAKDAAQKAAQADAVKEDELRVRASEKTAAMKADADKRADEVIGCIAGMVISNGSK